MTEPSPVLSSIYDDSFNFFLVGEPNVGKTCLLTQFCKEICPSHKIKKKKLFQVFTKTTTYKNKVIQLKFFDILLTDENINIFNQMMENSDGVIFVCSFDNKQSLEKLKQWYIKVSPYTALNSKEMILLVNKNDMEGKREISEKEIKMKCKDLRIDYYLVSAKTGKNVKKAFEEFIAKAVKNTYNKDYFDDDIEEEENDYIEDIGREGEDNSKGCNIF